MATNSATVSCSTTPALLAQPARPAKMKVLAPTPSIGNFWLSIGAPYGPNSSGAIPLPKNQWHEIELGPGDAAYLSYDGSDGPQNAYTVLGDMLNIPADAITPTTNRAAPGEDPQTLGGVLEDDDVAFLDVDPFDYAEME